MEGVRHVPILILGGGISGMGAAQKASEQDREFLLLEAASTLGGTLRSLEIHGHTVDIGANSCASSEDFEQFLSHIGLEDKILKANALSKKRYLFHDKKVVSVGGLRDILGASWLSLKGKLRIGIEPFQKRGNVEDESVASFLSRRIGWEATEKLVEPVLGGIYGGDIHNLSAATILKKFKVGEQQNGSILRTLFKDPPMPRKIISVEGGFAKIGEAFTQKHTDQVLLETKVQKIEKISSGFLVQTNRGNFDCEELIITLPVYVLAELLDGELKNLLGQLKYEELSVSHFAEELRQGAFDGFGILVPSSLNMKVKGVLFTSSIFKGRAPAGMRNMTVFHKASRMKSIQKELNTILGNHPRQLLHTYHWKQAIPQSHIGFGEWKKELFAQLPDGMSLAGNYLGKVGVADVFSSGYNLKI
tara:strand:+ start:9299 stop:10552 length:1254 start_codon:yes stop_codon:yes gene_type:complete